jgi:hypothetical protein
MKVVLRVSSSNEHCDGGCEFALVDLTPQLGATALRRIAVLREQKSLDPDVDETYYWAYVVEYFSPWVSLVSTEEEVELVCRIVNSFTNRHNCGIIDLPCRFLLRPLCP